MTRLPPLVAYEREQYLQRHSTFPRLFRYVVSGSSAGIWLYTQQVRGRRETGVGSGSNEAEWADEDDKDEDDAEDKDGDVGAKQRYGSFVSSVLSKGKRVDEDDDAWEDILVEV